MAKQIINNPGQYVEIHNMATDIVSKGTPKQVQIASSIMNQLAERGAVSGAQLSTISAIWIQCKDKKPKKVAAAKPRKVKSILG